MPAVRAAVSVRVFGRYDIQTESLSPRTLLIGRNLRTDTTRCCPGLCESKRTSGDRCPHRVSDTCRVASRSRRLNSEDLICETTKVGRHGHQTAAAIYFCGGVPYHL